jgi:hypothetical protein
MHVHCVVGGAGRGGGKERSRAQQQTGQNEEHGKSSHGDHDPLLNIDAYVTNVEARRKSQRAKKFS